MSNEAMMLLFALQRVSREKATGQLICLLTLDMWHSSSFSTGIQDALGYCCLLHLIHCFVLCFFNFHVIIKIKDKMLS